MSRKRVRIGATCCERSREDSTSAMPKMPIATGRKSMPSSSAGWPKISRCVPWIGSTPTIAIISPRSAAISALVGELVPRLAQAVMPSSASRKYSGALNFSANAASGGVMNTTAVTAATPARNEPIAEMLSAAPARPFRAIWCPSTAVMTLAASPGTLTSTEVSVPPYMPPYMIPASIMIAVAGGTP